MKTLLIVLLLILTGCSQATRVPLYEDPTGWMILSAYSGDRITSSYVRAKDRAREAGWATVDAEGMDYMAKDPLSFYGFAVLPQGHNLLWPEDAVITLRYTHGDDTLSVDSGEIFFCKEQMLHTMKLAGQRVYGPITVPNTHHRLYTTGSGNPVVFARFPLDREPDYLTGVTVANVYSIQKEVAR